jgi:DNA-binding NarL/FixJ family response regulator
VVIRVMIVDDQAVIRAGVARILSPDDGFEIVRELDDGDQVVGALAEVAVDLVLMDVRMRRVGGPDAVRRMRGPDPGGAEPPPVLMFTTFDDDDALWGALDAGAAGFVLKDCAAEELIAACRTVAAGGAWLDPQVAPRVMATFRRQVLPQIRERARADLLTEREHDVLRHMARGATNGEIAHRLTVGEATVKSHVGSIFSKLGVRDRAAAIVYAFDTGLVEPAPGPGP